MEIIVSLIIIFLILLIYLKQVKLIDLSDELIKIMTKNIDYLESYYKQEEVAQIKRTIQLCSNFQIVAKISKCDYISFFKYDYNRSYAILHFIISMDKTGRIIQDSILLDLDKLPASSSLLTLNILKSDDKDIYFLNKNEVEQKNDYIYSKMVNKNIGKFYYQNIFREDTKPIGFIVMSYNDENFIIPQNDKIDIIRLLEKTKSLI